MDAAENEMHLKRIEEDGYTILENVIKPELVAEFRDEIHRIERENDTAPKGNSV